MESTKTVKMVTLRAMYYDVDREAGEEFEATEEHADALVRAGSAELVLKVKPKISYQRRDLRAEK